MKISSFLFCYWTQIKKLSNKVVLEEKLSHIFKIVLPSLTQLHQGVFALTQSGLIEGFSSGSQPFISVHFVVLYNNLNLSSKYLKARYVHFKPGKLWKKINSGFKLTAYKLLSEYSCFIHVCALIGLSVPIYSSNSSTQTHSFQFPASKWKRDIYLGQ